MPNDQFDSQAKSFSSIWLREPFAKSRHATTIPIPEDKRLIISGKLGGRRKTGLSDLLTAIS